MPTYISLINWTEKGVAGFRDTVDRAEAGKALAAKLGGSLKEIYWTVGPYDIVAIIPIVAGAGGIVTTWENGPAQGGGRIIVAGDKRVHQAALEILAG